MCFFFNDTATTEIYTYSHTLSLHDALPICRTGCNQEKSIGLAHKGTQEECLTKASSRRPRLRCAPPRPRLMLGVSDHETKVRSSHRARADLLGGCSSWA